MARTRSNHVANRMRRINERPRFRRSRRPPGIAHLVLPAILLAWATTAFGSSGPGLAFKIGAQTLEDPVDLEKRTRARVELELSTARFCDDSFDLAFAFGSSYLGSITDEFVDVVDGVLFEEFYTDRLFLLDLRLAARLYPLGNRSSIRPYLGGGLGYFWFLDHWHADFAETIEDPFFPGTFHTFTDHAEGTDTAARGLFPFVTAGVNVPIGDNGELIFEFQYDFDKEDSGFDFGGPIYMLGARIRF